MVDEQRIMWTRFSMLFRPMFRSYVMFRKGKVANKPQWWNIPMPRQFCPNRTEQVIWLSNASFEKNSFNWESCFASELKYIYVIDTLKKHHKVQSNHELWVTKMPTSPLPQLPHQVPPQTPHQVIPQIEWRFNIRKDIPSNNSKDGFLRHGQLINFRLFQWQNKKNHVISWSRK